jgi:hypothetical protein
MNSSRPGACAHASGAYPNFCLNDSLAVTVKKIVDEKLIFRKSAPALSLAGRVCFCVFSG